MRSQATKNCGHKRPKIAVTSDPPPTPKQRKIIDSQGRKLVSSQEGIDSYQKSPPSPRCCVEIFFFWGGGSSHPLPPKKNDDLIIKCSLLDEYADFMCFFCFSKFLQTNWGTPHHGQNFMDFEKHQERKSSKILQITVEHSKNNHFLPSITLGGY